MEPARGVIWPFGLKRKPLMSPLSELTTYRRWPLVSRLTGRSPPEDSRSTSVSAPCLRTLKELIVSSPAFTANSSRPFFVSSMLPWESTIGKPNGGVEAAPTPPVATRATSVRVPFEARL